MDPYYFLDNFSLKIFNRELNIFNNDISSRTHVLKIIGFAFIAWFIMGYDSAASQLALVLHEYFLKYVWGLSSIYKLIEVYQLDYGRGVHWSAFIIYGLMYYSLSNYYSKHLDIVKSRNMVLAGAFTFFSMGFFETFWHYSYAYLQNQMWTLRPQFPQLSILIQSRSWLLLPPLYFLIFHVKHDSQTYIKNLPKFIPAKYRLITWTTFMPQLRFNINYKLIIVSVLALSSMWVWWNYGLFFPVQKISVDVVGAGVWSSTPYFPQTVYTVETNVLDNICAGNHFWIENNLLHSLNILVKVLVTLVTYLIGKVKHKCH